MVSDILIKKINRYFHDEEAEFFSLRHNKRMKRESQFYERFFRAYPHETGRAVKILDIGTGQGLVPRALPSAEYRIVCTDISFAMIKSAQLDLYKKSYVTRMVCDAETLPFKSDAFDIITCNAALHHFPSVPGFSSEVDRILKAGGVLIISFESNRRFWTNKLVSLPHRLLKHFLKNSDTGIERYETLYAKVNDRLIREGVLKEPIPGNEIMKYIDIHSPNACGKIDYSKGFDIQELTKRIFNGYSTKVIYHYNAGPAIFDIYNRILFPKCAPQFSIIFKKGER